MPSVSWSRFSDEFLGLYGEPFGAKATALKHRQILREFSALGIERTRDLNESVVTRWVREHQGRRPRSNLSLLKHLRTAVNYGRKKGYFARSPFDFRPVHKWVPLWRTDQEEEPEEAAKHLTRREVARVLAHLATKATTPRGRRIYALVATLAYTGMRKNEALHLRTANVDLEGGFVRIGGQRLKTAASAARIPMPPPLIEILRSYMPTLTGEWVFPGATGRGPWTGGAPGYRPLDVAKAEATTAGVPGFTFLKLRHAYATHGERWGLSDLEVSRVLRHTTTRTAQEHYRHADLENLREAVRRVSYRVEDAGSA